MFWKSYVKIQVDELELVLICSAENEFLLKKLTHVKKCFKVI